MILDAKKIIPLLGIEHGMTVLDIGSSIGFWAKPLAQRVGHAGKIIAVDYHENSIARLQNDCAELGLSMIFPITADIHHVDHFPVKPETCHRVLLVRMMSVIHDSLETVIPMLQKLLRENGTMMIIDSVQYQPSLCQFLDDHHIAYTPIPLVAERTDHYFFGVAISR